MGGVHGRGRKIQKERLTRGRRSQPVDPLDRAVDEIFGQVVILTAEVGHDGGRLVVYRRLVL